MIQDTTKKNYTGIESTIQLTAPTWSQANRIVFIPDGSELAYAEYMGLKAPTAPTAPTIPLATTKRVPGIVKSLTVHNYRAMVNERNERLMAFLPVRFPDGFDDSFDALVDNEETDREIMYFSVERVS